MVAEREALGQVAAALPVLVGWEIKHTPGPHDDASEALAFAGDCDLFVAVLGADFAAPMGLEWQLAARQGREIGAYRKRTMPSPSAKALLRQSEVTWTLFSDAAELKALVADDLAQSILNRAEYYGLRLDEVEALAAALGPGQGQEDGEPDTRRGAERGGVIIGRGA
jgi:hypothetical protein